MKILVSAAEISSDIQAESCVRALYDRLAATGAEVEIAGIGGPKVRSLPGFRCIEPAENLRAMGVSELLNSYLYIRKVGYRLIDFALEFKPDLFITFDYPNFHLEVMKKLQPRIKDNPLRHALKICAIPPKLWVWREGRIKKIRRFYDGVLVIFPFEQEFYQKRGVPVIYEGNPLIANLPFATTPSEALETLGCTELVAAGWTPVAVFPGSRDGELKHNLPVIGKALEQCAEQSGKKLLALIPVTPGVRTGAVFSGLRESDRVAYRVMEGHAHACLIASRAGLIKSGTATLEAVLLGVTPVIFYRTGLLTEWTFRFVTRYSGPVGLPNILLGVKKRADSIFPEFLGPESTPEALSKALSKALAAPEDPSRRRGLLDKLAPHQNVSGEIADRVLEWLKQRPAKAAGSPG